jgi:hypothetical protein
MQLYELFNTHELLPILKRMVELIETGEMAGISTNVQTHMEMQHFDVTSFHSRIAERRALSTGEIKVNWTLALWPGEVALARQRAAKRRRAILKRRRDNARKGYYGKPMQRRKYRFGPKRPTSIQRWLEAIRETEYLSWE